MFAPTPRREVQDLRVSKIREVANAGMGRDDILAFWFGEGDQPTPEFIRRAASDALLSGRTYYTHNLGRPELRQSLSRYLSGLHGAPIAEDRIAVTSAGVSALMLAAQIVLSPGDRTVVAGPIWPNVVEIPKILSSVVEVVPVEAAQGRWRLDMDRLMAALTPDTRALVLNSPNNPTGWTLPAEDRGAILERCRRYGIWLICDDVYERLTFDRPSAPSFLPLVTGEDRVIGVNSFSKAWRMTGWRLGWMVVPPALMESLGVLVEYNTSCAPDFVQAGAKAAVDQGEPIVAELRAELAAARNQVVGTLRTLPGVEAPMPDGGLYAFFRVEGCTDSLALAKELITEAGLGLAPGAAFGPEGEGWLRWCFAARPEKNAAGLERLAGYLKNR
ncbi:MAG: aminotransferase class I/II-fold pyridoxal phosphate-dependent enzyme [Phenylobacterium sp.]|uniref:pyridoxal phosphate-dependent aminotransferase n=1 Tax=Phenylobacterium sp. TaxID=1871053 RepID=UPI0011F5F784|nr:pyridoxal phosphate-dependent aminotransferase [Phenylobacterium sp.]TAJ70260.1 MAG: aminotransferase class I/II-fold pyridoxal phosphate-dependent enzyme [Phenylobacterium sp.]